MSMETLDWIEVDDRLTKKKIGAVGFLGDEAAIVVAYYDDLDWDNDGKVSKVEFVSSKAPIMKNLFFKSGRQLTSVYMQALGDPDITMRDTKFRSDAAQHFLDFSSGLIFEGIYLVYFSRGIKGLSSGIAKAATNSIVKQYVIRKGMEKAVKTAFDKAVEHGIHK